MKAIKKIVWVTSFFNGFHCWPDAPDKVAFLRQLHRHKFGVKVGVNVSGSDREVEFFCLQNDVNKILVKVVSKMLVSKPSMSCEMMAELIAECLAKDKYSISFVNVDEDGENGAMLQYSEI